MSSILNVFSFHEDTHRKAFHTDLFCYDAVPLVGGRKTEGQAMAVVTGTRILRIPRNEESQITNDSARSLITFYNRFPLCALCGHKWPKSANMFLILQITIFFSRGHKSTSISSKDLNTSYYSASSIQTLKL